jgi:hypothetical protein
VICDPDRWETPNHIGKGAAIDPEIPFAVHIRFHSKRSGDSQTLAHNFLSRLSRTQDEGNQRKNSRQVIREVVDIHLKINPKQKQNPSPPHIG